MELKDVILSTLAEMEDNETTKKVLNSSIEIKKVQNKNAEKKHTFSSAPMIKEKKQIPEDELPQNSKDEDLKDEDSTNENYSSIENEESFLNSLKERMLVLFEGFQAPNNTNLDAKVDMTLNFLEFVLASIELRKEELKKGNQK